MFAKLCSRLTIPTFSLALYSCLIYISQEEQTGSTGKKGEKSEKNTHSKKPPQKPCYLFTSPLAQQLTRTDFESEAGLQFTLLTKRGHCYPGRHVTEGAG